MDFDISTQSREILKVNSLMIQIEYWIDWNMREQSLMESNNKANLIFVLLQQCFLSAGFSVFLKTIGAKIGVFSQILSDF